MEKKRRTNNKYSTEFKLKVVEKYLSIQSGGVNSIAKKHGLKSPTQLRNWIKKYRIDPQLLAEDNRGRKSKGRRKKIKLDEMSLEEQNAYLRMENDILKKAKALREKYGEH